MFKLGKFHGKKNVALDAKNRFTVPMDFYKQYRDKEQKILFMLVVQGTYPRIDFFFETEDLEKEIERRQEEVNPFASYDEIDDMFIGNLDDLSLDRQGRTNAISARHLKDAGIVHDLVVVGRGNYISAYDPQVYESYCENRSNSIVKHDMARAAASDKYNERLANGEVPFRKNLTDEL